MLKQLECRVVVTLWHSVFDMGMYDPVSGRYEPLGTHPRRDEDKVVGGLKERIEREGHLLTFSVVRGPR